MKILKKLIKLVKGQKPDQDPGQVSELINQVKQLVRATKGQKPDQDPGQVSELINQVKQLVFLVKNQTPAPDYVPDPSPEPEQIPEEQGSIDPVKIENEIRKQPQTINTIKGALNKAGWPIHTIHTGEKIGINTPVFATAGGVRIPTNGYFYCFIAVDRQVITEKKLESEQ